MPNNNALHIRLFGNLSISTSDSEPIEIPPSRAGALLALLAIETSNKRPWTREEIVDLLWPEDEAETARHKLRQTLYDVRRQIAALKLAPESVLLATRSSLQLNPEYICVDAATFEAEVKAASSAPNIALRAVHLQRAVEMYRGELLPGFYQERFISQRTRLEEAHHAALKSLALAYEETEEYDRGIETACRLVSLNPLNEEAHFALMRLYAATGQPSLVLRQYQSLKRALKEELGEAPSKRAQNVMEALRETAVSRATDRGVGGPPNSRRPVETENIASGDSAIRDPASDPAGIANRQPAIAHRQPEMSQRHKIRLTLSSLATLAVAVFVLIAALRTRRHIAESTHVPPNKPHASITVDSTVLARYDLAADERGSEPTALATDLAGNLYVAGFVETTHNDADFITIKYDSTGREQWRRRYNGTGNDVDRLRCIGVDAVGNVYVSGESDNGNGNGSTRLSGLDIVTIKYSSNGQELWQDRYNDIDNGDDRPVRMVLDSLGNAYVLCSCRRLRNSMDAGSDFVLIKYGAGGKRLWMQRYDGDAHDDDVPTGMALLYKDSGVCVCGYSRAVYKSGSEYDYVTIKYSADGNCLWTKRYGANGRADSYARDVSADQDGDVYVVGEGYGFPGTPDESRTGCIMVKYGPSGETLWARGTVKESDRLQRVTATAFWYDGHLAAAGPCINENGETMYRVVMRDSDGGTERRFDTLAPFQPLYNAPCALVIWTEDVTHDSVWMVGSRVTRPKHPTEFVVASLSNHVGVRWTNGFNPTSGFNSARAAVLSKLKGVTMIIVAGLCTDTAGKGGITLVQYSEY